MSRLFELSNDQIEVLTDKVYDFCKSKDGSEFRLNERLNKFYPHDIGSVVAFLLNYVVLQPGEALVLAANEPHAYLQGVCIEAMATSDNVV